MNSKIVRGFMVPSYDLELGLLVVLVVLLIFKQIPNHKYSNLVHNFIPFALWTIKPSNHQSAAC